jgi:hypothetical protein
MNTIGKVTDATVIVGSLVVGYGGINAIMNGVKGKSAAIIAIGALTTLISIYAFKEAMQKIQE